MRVSAYFMQRRQKWRIKIGKKNEKITATFMKYLNIIK